MSKSKSTQKLAGHLAELLTSVQKRAFWLTDEFRKLADKVNILAQKQRNDTAILQQVQSFAKEQTDKVVAAHNRLRFDFDNHALGQQGPHGEVAALRQYVADLNTKVQDTRDAFLKFTGEAGEYLGTFVGTKYGEFVQKAEDAVAELQKAHNLVAQDSAETIQRVEGLEKTVDILRAEVDRLRTLAASRADLAVAKYNELESKVQASLQRFNERVSALETLDGRALQALTKRHETLTESVGYLSEKVHEPRVTANDRIDLLDKVITRDTRFQQSVNQHNAFLIESLQKRVASLEQPREIRLLVAAPVDSPPTTTGKDGEPGNLLKPEHLGWSPNIKGPVKHS